MLGVAQVDLEERSRRVRVGVDDTDVRVRSKRINECEETRITELHGLERKDVKKIRAVLNNHNVYRLVSNPLIYMIVLYRSVVQPAL